MNLFADRNLRRLFFILVLVFMSAVLTGLILARQNTEWIKNEILKHDYSLAGALLEKNPELSDEIRSAFSLESSAERMEQGRALLEQSGYKRTMQASLMPEAEGFRKQETAAILTISILAGLAVIFSVYMYCSSQNERIEQYDREIRKIMAGETGVRLKDDDEGSLPVLAASINQLVSSMKTHIEKEKQSRIFLKDIIENISHQLKTPLSALSMYTEIMKEEPVENEVVSGFLNKSENELERMQGLVKNLLKLARLDAGIIELDKKKHLIREIVLKAAGSLSTRMEMEGKSFSVIAEYPVYYLCDFDWMLEAFGNLIKNAVEHTTAGGRIEVSVEESPLFVNVVFSDNGEGIHPEDINHIFKRFYRSRFSQNKQGTGIGLALAKSVVELHGGYISVDSTLKKGTVFTVNLPKLTN